MKSDLDRLMAERDYAALMVTGGTHDNPPMYYLANGVHLGAATVLIKKRGEQPILFVHSMERDEAAKSGLPTVDTARFNLAGLIREAQGDRLQATARWYGRLFAEAGVAGRVVVLGRADQGAAYERIRAINAAGLGVTLVGEFDHSLFTRAAATKDAAEVRRIRAVGKKAVRIVGAVQDFLTSHRAKAGVLVKKDGARLTVGDVKQYISLQLMQAGIVDAEDGTIFAIGRDGGVPHSRGNDRDPIALGKAIVFDFFPAEAGGGYFFDFTRTWCLGHAPPLVQETYDTVLGAFRQVMKALTPNENCRVYQKMTCDYFEQRGHPTIQSDPATTRGYVHGLGHGIGLHIHEAPALADFEGNTSTLEPGVVFTVEPGLYYPDHPKGGFGVRLEDSVWLNPDTLKFEVLAPYPKDLVLPVKDAKASIARKKK